MSQRHVSSIETATLPAPSEATMRPRPWVHAFAGPAAPWVARLDAELVIGREGDAALCDASLSRRHLRLKPVPEGMLVEDLGSRNGTFLQGSPLRGGIFAPPFVLRAGTTLLRVSLRTERHAPAVLEEGLVGGDALGPLRRQIGLVAQTALPVLVLGETGTGKDIVARRIHEASGRRGPLLPVNCPTLPVELAESELFGHARAAFTGAQGAREGLLVTAHGGTLFLDEIADLPLPAQAKLLRVLEDGEVRPVGSDRSRTVDVRVISATHRDLRRLAQEGHFRMDLYARLAVITLQTPPLRDHIEDLPALANHLLARAHRRGRIEPDALEALAIHDWPMNVRELDAALHTAALAGGDVTLDQLPAPLREAFHVSRRMSPPRCLGGTPELSVETPVSRFEAALRKSHGNVRKAAEYAGISRSHAYRLMRKHGLEPGRFRDKGDGT